MNYNILDKCKDEEEHCGRQPYPPFTHHGKCCEGAMCKPTPGTVGGRNRCVGEGNYFLRIDLYYILFEDKTYYLTIMIFFNNMYNIYR